MDDIAVDIVSESVIEFIELDGTLANLIECKIYDTLSSYDNATTVYEALEIMEDYEVYLEGVRDLLNGAKKKLDERKEQKSDNSQVRKGDTDDIEKNLNKFLKGEENILFIIGNAGSGKSTLAKHYQGSIPNCYDVELDRLFTSVRTKNATPLPDEPQYKIFDGWDKYLKGEDVREEEVFRKAFKLGQRRAEADKSHKYIFTGIQTQNLFNANYLGNFPIIVKGTGKNTAKVRKLNRIKADYENGDAESPTAKMDAAIKGAGKQLRYMSKKGSVGDWVGKKLEQMPDSDPAKRAKANLMARDGFQGLVTQNKVNGTIRSNAKRMDKLRKDLAEQNKYAKDNSEKAHKLGVRRGGEEIDRETGTRKVPEFVKNKTKDTDNRTSQQKKEDRAKAVQAASDKLNDVAKKAKSAIQDAQKIKDQLKDAKRNLKSGGTKDSNSTNNRQDVSDDKKSN